MRMRFPLRSIGILLAVLLLVGLMISPVAAGSSMMFRMNPQHTGDYSSVSGGPLENTIKKWDSPVSLYGGSTPSVVDDVVYVGSGIMTVYGPNRPGYVYAIDAVTGELKWTYETRNMVVSSPAVLNDEDQTIVYVGDWDGWVYALNADDNGAMIWEYKTGDTIQSSPAVAGDSDTGYTVYIGSNDDKVYAFDAKTGALKWPVPYQTMGDVQSSPAVWEDKVYIGSNDNEIYALNKDTGARIWSFPTGGWVRSSPAVAPVGQDTYVFFGSDDCKVYALDARTGGKMWDFDTKSWWVDSSPAVAYDATTNGYAVYVGGGYKLYAINAETGKERWSVPMVFAIDTPSVADGVVYVKGCSQFYGYDAATGRQEKMVGAPGCPSGLSPMVVVDGTIYYGGEGSLYAWGVHKPIVDDFTGTPTEGTADPSLSVTFEAETRYHPDTWKWEYKEKNSPGGFSLGQVTTSPTVSLNFPPGIYNIRLTAFNRGGTSNTLTKPEYINALPPAPVADFTGSPQKGTVPFTVTFTYKDRGSADPQYLTSLEWSFKKHPDTDWTPITPPGPGIPTTITKRFSQSEDGIYDIRVIAKNRGGDDEEKRENYIDAWPLVPVVEKIEADRTTGKTILDVKFKATVSNNPTRLTWVYRKAGVTYAAWIGFKQQQTLTPTQRFSWGTWEIMLQACNRNPTACGVLSMPGFIKVDPPVLVMVSYCKIAPWFCLDYRCKVANTGGGVPYLALPCLK